MGQKLMKSIFQLYYLSSVLDREWKNELEPRCVLLIMNRAGTRHTLLALKKSLLLLEVAQNTQCIRKTRQCSPIAQLPNLSSEPCTGRTLVVYVCKGGEFFFFLFFKVSLAYKVMGFVRNRKNFLLF